MASQATRQVYVRIKPLPRTIQDTKEVLNALQKYGEVLTFRNLRYDSHVHGPNVALAIYQSHKAVVDVTAAAPLQVEVEEPPSTLFKSTPFASSGQRKGPRPPDKESSRTRFTVNVTPSYIDHGPIAERNPYGGNWHINHTVAYEDLKTEVPVKEYADCSLRDDLDLRASLQRVHRFKHEAETSRESLMDLWREGLEKQKRSSSKT